MTLLKTGCILSVVVCSVLHDFLEQQLKLTGSNPRYLIAIFLVAIVGILIWFAASSPIGVRIPHARSSKPSTPAETAHAKVVEGNKAYRDLRYRSATKQYQTVVNQYEATKDPAVAKEVASAQSYIAYCYARRGDFQSAAMHFQTVADKYPHSWPVVEDAVLQHAICLKQTGNTKQALAEFEKLVAARPSSDIFTNACGYIRRLNNGKLTPNAEASMARFKKEEEAAQRKQALENAMCGPKALAYVCTSIGVKTDYKELAKLAGTGVHGTSMDDLAKAARLKGCEVAGLQVTFKGLKSQPKPLLALIDNHYLVIERVSRKSVELLDVSGNAARRFSIPADSLFERWGGFILRVSIKGEHNV